MSARSSRKVSLTIAAGLVAVSAALVATPSVAGAAPRSDRGGASAASSDDGRRLSYSNNNKKFKGVRTGATVTLAPTPKATTAPTTTAPTTTAPTTTAPTTTAPTTTAPTTTAPTTTAPTTTAPTTTAPTTTAPTTTAPTTTAPTTTAPTATTNSSPSGEPMPVGDLANWKQVFTDDFTTPVNRGSFPGSYSNKWTLYDGFYDTFQTAYYDKNAISVQNGALDLYLHTNAAGTPIGSAPVPIVTKPWEGQTYGRYSVRFKSDKLPGYKTAWLLWPVNNNWNEGEIDFPEGGLDGKISAFNHCVGNPALNCYWADTDATYQDWHTATIEWSPNRITYILDGKVVGTTTQSVPNTEMRWVLQTESNGNGRPAKNVAGSVQIDWVTVYTWKG